MEFQGNKDAVIDYVRCYLGIGQLMNVLETDAICTLLTSFSPQGHRKAVNTEGMFLGVSQGILVLYEIAVGYSNVWYFALLSLGEDEGRYHKRRSEGGTKCTI